MFRPLVTILRSTALKEITLNIGCRSLNVVHGYRKWTVKMSLTEVCWYSLSKQEGKCVHCASGDHVYFERDVYVHISIILGERTVGSSARSHVTPHWLIRVGCPWRLRCLLRKRISSRTRAWHYRETLAPVFPFIIVRCQQCLPQTQNISSP
jgi:hypothetical protein